MFYPYGIEPKRARRELAQPQVWHAGDVSVSPEQGEARERAFERTHALLSIGVKHMYQW
jgi:hypothetical protein